MLGDFLLFSKIYELQTIFFLLGNKMQNDFSIKQNFYWKEPCPGLKEKNLLKHFHFVFCQFEQTTLEQLQAMIVAYT